MDRMRIDRLTLIWLCAHNDHLGKLEVIENLLGNNIQADTQGDGLSLRGNSNLEYSLSIYRIPLLVHRYRRSMLAYQLCPQGNNGLAGKLFQLLHQLVKDL
jgi:hypothetical protein